MKTPRNSLDSKILKWSGAVMVAFLVAVLASGSPAGARGDAGSAAEGARPASTCAKANTRPAPHATHSSRS
jgi:hypothetical protein